MPSSRRNLLAASNNAGGDKLYVEDVFSPYVWNGDADGTRNIVNGIDLLNNGGMVWTKSGRFFNNALTYPHLIIDSERGFNTELQTSQQNGAVEYNTIREFNEDGFGINNGFMINSSGSRYVSWTFRKAKKFFDVVTWTGSQDLATDIGKGIVAHNLGVAPAVIIIKNTTDPTDWIVYHKDVGTSTRLVLNSALPPTNFVEADQYFAKYIGQPSWQITAPDSENIYVGKADESNGQNATMVAYLFASDAGGFGESGDENIIKCGQFTMGPEAASIGGDGVTVELGWEPQYVLIKAKEGTFPWRIIDTTRHWSLSSTEFVWPSNNAAPYNYVGGDYTNTTATGFRWNLGLADIEYLYIAIRRPMKVPTSASEVYNTITRTGTGAVANVEGLGFAPDFMTTFHTATAGQDKVVFDRLRGPTQYLATSSTSQEINVGTNGLISFDVDGFTTNANGYANNNGSAFVNHCFKRAPGFMDIVHYTGNGSSAGQVIKHNLVATPELIIIKGRSNNGREWQTYVSSLGQSQALFLNTAGQVQANSAFTGGTTNSTQFELKVDFGNVNGNAETYIAYLFATLAGISKVGSYTGTAATLTVDCGFAAGARFILIKRTDASGDWYLWDSVRGIVAGDDPYILLNSDAEQVTDKDWVDPHTTGFQVSDEASSLINVVGGAYIFLAIA